MRKIIFYIGGASYPADHNLETAFAQLADADTEFVSHKRIMSFGEGSTSADDASLRLFALDKAVSALSGDREIFLIGRSRGARIITQFAHRRPVTGVICLGYPFKAPGQVLEYDRFGFLASLSTPTLIVQGVRDVYGGVEVTENYQLSDAIALKFFLGDHDIALPPAEMARLIDLARVFIDRQWRDPAVLSDPFDEAYYLRRHPDVARAVRVGDIPSGEAHFHRFGRDERRRYRLRPAPLK